MNMTDYLKEIEYAATTIFPVVWAEQEELAALNKKIRQLTKAVDAQYQTAAAWQDSEDPEDVAFGGGIFMETYFGPDKEKFGAEADRAKILVKQFSVDALAEAILQYAKQGISIVFAGYRKKCKATKLLGTQPLADVIWAGRNQSLHWEDKKFQDTTANSFKKLEAEVCKRFGEFEKGNQALHLLSHLGWKDFAAFKADMQSLE